MEHLTIEGTNPDSSFSYDIIWSDSFAGLYDCMKNIPDLRPGRICIVTDSHVEALYLKALKDALSSFPGTIDSFIFPEGEQNKNLETVCDLYRFLIERHFDRKDLLIALGGGVAGDMTGFTAATYLRGIDFIQIPTTLLAQTDSSVGGKTGVDMDGFKNMVGAFHQPRLVYMNMSVLRTLSGDQFVSGMGEVVKTALLGSRPLYDLLKKSPEQICRRDPEILTSVISACCRVKGNIVRQDPTEKGLRAILNLGHTLGHAVEKCSNFALLHGQCVGIGLNAACWLSSKRGYISREEYEDIRNLLKCYGIPAAASGLTADELLDAARSDKKMVNGRIRFILLRAVGEAFTDLSVSDEEILAAASVILTNETSGDFLS